jgi:hypothetical protein
MVTDLDVARATAIHVLELAAFGSACCAGTSRQDGEVRGLKLVGMHGQNTGFDEDGDHALHGVDFLGCVSFGFKHVPYQELGRDGGVGMHVDGNVAVPHPVELDLSVILRICEGDRRYGRGGGE